MWHWEKDLRYSYNSTARKQFASRILNDMSALHSMAIDLSPCHDKLCHWLGIDVDSLLGGGSFKGSPLCLLGDKHPVRTKNGQQTAVTACYIQNALRQMKADRAGAVFQTAGLIQQPFFSSYCCLCVCFVSIPTRFIHKWMLSRWRSYWNCSRYLM